MDRAWRLAAHFRQPQACDAFYLAVADLSRIPFRTADRRLYDAVHDEFRWAHLLDEREA